MGFYVVNIVPVVIGSFKEVENYIDILVESRTLLSNFSSDYAGTTFSKYCKPSAINFSDITIQFLIIFLGVYVANSVLVVIGSFKEIEN